MGWKMPAANLMWKLCVLPTSAHRRSRKSNAFAISSKLGLPDFIIERAKEQISQKDESFEDVLTSLENSRVIIENERQETQRYKQEIEALKQELQAKQEKLDQRKERILREANEEARKVLADAKEYADQTMKMFHKFQKDHVGHCSYGKRAPEAPPTHE